MACYKFKDTVTQGKYYDINEISSPTGTIVLVRHQCRCAVLRPLGSDSVAQLLSYFITLHHIFVVT